MSRTAELFTNLPSVVRFEGERSRLPEISMQNRDGRAGGTIVVRLPRSRSVIVNWNNFCGRINLRTQVAPVSARAMCRSAAVSHLCRIFGILEIRERKSADLIHSEHTKHKSVFRLSVGFSS